MTADSTQCSMAQLLSTQLLAFIVLPWPFLLVFWANDPLQVSLLEATVLTDELSDGCSKKAIDSVWEDYSIETVLF